MPGPACKGRGGYARTKWLVHCLVPAGWTQKEVIGLELPRLLEALPIPDHHRSSAKLDHSLGAKLLQHSVHMDSAQAHCVRDFRLRDRPLEAPVPSPSDRLQA